ncbi:hypothetical protein HK097_003707 [Rhizophlyctis rosea]|uniref:39S ribosomal protein L22, mitochondrial n=1 Tax=Rhizophlyctis rosea TaxID=64517 RepID=A0AAD5X9X8_9FUNG|nr:hypothetical protein HK097_003707 [Rhizophlyctis rosea]
MHCRILPALLRPQVSLLRTGTFLPPLTRTSQLRYVADVAAAKPTAAASSLFEAAIADAKKEDPSLPTLSSTSTSSTTTTKAGPTARDVTKIPTFSTGNYQSSLKKTVPMARIIRKMTIDQAYLQMTHFPKKSAQHIAAALRRIKSHLQHNYGEDPKRFILDRVWVGKGVYIRGMVYHAKGKFGIKHKPFVHVKFRLKKFERAPRDPKEKEFQEMVKILRKSNKVPMILQRDNRRVRNNWKPWSDFNWKHLTNEKWLDPDHIRKVDT